MPKLSITAGLILLSAALLVTACGDDANEDISTGDASGGSEAQAIEVTAANFSFSPASLSVDPGEEVSLTLRNEDGVEHSFTIDSLDVDTEAEGGEEGTTEFTAPDSSVEFYCRYHPMQMRGTLNVTGDAGGAAAPTSDSSTGGNYRY